MQAFKPWGVMAVNQAKRSDNPIHDDRTAREYGFRAGLVPGVTVFAYLTHPALSRWGESWLDRGCASIALSRPFYEGEELTVDPKADSPHSYACEIRNPAGETCATGTASLPEAPPPAPTLRGDAAAPEPSERPWASRAALERLSERGMGSVRVGWRGEPPYDRYIEDLEEMPAEVRPDQRAFANWAFLLSLANHALTANVRLGPWIHVESELQSFARLPLGRTAVVEADVLDLFERSGHEFCDLRVHAFFKEGSPIATIRHRVIYRLRQGPVEPRRIGGPPPSSDTPSEPS